MEHLLILNTDRVVLKSINPAFIHAIFDSRSKEEIMNFFGCDEGGYERYKDMHERGMETNRLSLFSFLLVDKATNRPLGECGFHTWNATHRRAELFYVILKEEDRRKGYMTEVLPHVLTAGFNSLNLHRIEALVGEENTPSVRLLKNHGFTFEGTMREDYVIDGISYDSQCYSLLKHEWKGKVK